MKKIKTKFSLGQLFGMPLLILGLFFGIGTLLLFDGFSGNPSKTSSETASIWGVIFLFTMGIYFLFLQVKNLKIISVENSGIFIKSIFSTKFLPWKNISYFELTGYESLLAQSTPATCIILKKGEKEIIFDLFYRNMPEFKRFLNEIAKQRKANQPINIEIISPEKLPNIPDLNDFRGYKKYSGAQLLSINGVFFYLLTAIICYSVFMSESYDLSDPIRWILPIISWWLIAWFYGHQFHYFQISPQILVIKNQLFFWKKKTVRLSDIREISFETPHRRAKGIRITTEDFESGLYLAGSLSKHTWNELRTELTKRKVKVF